MKMKRSELKMLVKECIREIIQEQINPASVQEMFAAVSQPTKKNAQSLGLPGLGMVNPMDEHAMRMRNELLAQKNMLQSQLQRQSAMNPLNQSVAGLSELAAVPSNVPDGPSRYNSNNSGYMSPLDRLRQAGPPRHAYDPSLDGQKNTRQLAARNPQAISTDYQATPEMPSPDILKSIFDDTMKTTLLEQHNAEQNGPVADKFAAAVADRNPEELFEGSKNWAALAFKF